MGLRVLIAPTAFKGSLSPLAAAGAIARGLRAALPDSAELVERPLADGGDGTLEVLLHALGGHTRSARVRDPLGREVEAEFGLLETEGQHGRVAVVEMARAAGLARLKPEERDPLRASTYGVGQLVRAALDAQAGEIWLGLGGSATVDGGAGFLKALGAKLLDARGREIPEGGAGLSRLARLDLSTLDPRLRRVRLVALLDVRNPLLGPRGARLYMPQKGATPEQCDALERALARFAEVAHRDLGVDVRGPPGAGAAGGLGAALALLGAELVPGSAFIAEKLGLRSLVQGCDWVIGGEGRVDEQTLEGKALAVLAELAQEAKKPLVVLCGARPPSLDALHELHKAGPGLTALLPIVPGPIALEDAMAQARALLEAAGLELGRLIRALSAL